MGEPQSCPFLDLAAQYHAEVYDLVHFTFDTASASNYALNDITTGAGTLVVSKIIDGLRNWGGYGDQDIAKVAGLVGRNVYSCHSRQVWGEMARITGGEGGQLCDVPRLAVELMCRGLLDTAVTRDRAVHVNSNEPVLLINLDGDGNGRMTARERDSLNYITNIAVTEVQHRWNIRPVRVYAGMILQTPQDGGGEGGGEEGVEQGDGLPVPSFSIALLNVVNTDIGGPSMPELLDAPCTASEWSRVLRKEVWRERELVSQEENADLFEPHVAEDASEHSFGSADDDESVGSDAERLVNWEDMERREGDLHEIESDHGEDGEIPQEGSTVDDTQGNDIPPQAQFDDLSEADNAEDDGRKHGLPEDEAHEEDIPQADELPIRHIKHPSWDRRDDSISLLDLIKSQVSIIAPFGTETAGHGVHDLEGNVAGPAEVKAPAKDSDDEIEAAAVEGKQAQAKSSSEDDFVVV